MATTNGNKKILDLKRWDFCSPPPVASGAGVLVAPEFCYTQLALIVQSASVHYLYDANEDSYVQLPSAALAGTFGAGATAVGIPWSTGATIGAASLTATGGTSTTLVTNQTLARDLRGFQIQLLEGTSAGDIRTIASNTIGANATITVTSAFTASPTVTTTYRLLTPRWLVVNAGIQATGSVKFYDYATNTWTSVSQTSLPVTVGTDSAMASTSCYVGSSFNPLATGTSTGTNTVNTLNNTGKAWTTNQFTNMQIRITSGTGAGQIRTIASNTATTITTSANWTTTPDATSTYAIEGNDDHIYHVGSATANMYRYTISTNTWTTVGLGRAGSSSAGVSLNYFFKTGDATWGTENAIINGRRLYSFRGGGNGIVDYYDIPSGTWTAPTYSPATETFTTGSSYAYDDSYIYIEKESTGRWLRFDPVRSCMEPWGVTTYTQGAAAVGNRSWMVYYIDGATTIRYVYFWLNTSSVILRQLVI
jgi:hypothetical protein